ncbi:HlyD family type I secretion periplasmic adaptor subunit [Marinomonas ostreistagni]|nr:HlyD family type I secretion periplasmic adaptor subunit [Marinomonas ostreistagni]
MMFNKLSSKQTIEQSDLDFLSDRNAAMMLKTPRGGRLLLWSVFAFLVCALVWANFTYLDEVTVGQGKVIPSSQVQVIQNLEGGILKEVNVRVGQSVAQGELLMTIENTEALSSLRERQVERMNLMVRAARLDAEANGEEPKFTTEMQSGYQEIINREMDLYRNRQISLTTNQAIFEQQIAQKEQEVVEQNAKLSNLEDSFQLASEELRLTRPAFEQGAVSRVELLQLERQVNQLQGDLQATKLAIPRARSALQEARTKLAESTAKFRADAQEQLTDVRAQLDQLRESSVTLEDKVDRTLVRSPVKGIVKQVQINTVGGVIKPGMSLMEIVPVDDSLLIEAKVRPEDVGFIKPELKAVVKLSAYDFSIYGGLDAEVENISADTILDEEGNSFYVVRVRTNKNFLGPSDAPLNIIPGMQSTVDIITGKKSVLDYLMKPIFKAQQNALRER